MLKCDDRKTCINVDILYRDKWRWNRNVWCGHLKECPHQYAKRLSIFCAGERKTHQGEVAKARCKEMWQCEEWEDKITARMREQCGEDKEGRGRAHISWDRRQRKPLGCGCQSAVMGFVALTASIIIITCIFWSEISLMTQRFLSSSIQDSFGIPTLGISLYMTLDEIRLLKDLWRLYYRSLQRVEFQ